MSNTSRIAKNTLLLYFRMLLTMAVSLYTSRVILCALGVEDYGIYNVVGGVVAMFGILSGSLSSAISRFITFELGKGDFDKLKRIFSTSVNIQIILIGIITVLMETVGIWFLNAKMVIPEERMSAANWVFQFSVVTFAINLLSVPYNAAIIAHERMSAFAYISIVDVTLKLIVAFIITYNPFDRLVYYGLLIMVVGVIIRFLYGVYCKRHFEETRYEFVLDKGLMKDMFGFAGWDLFGTGSAILRDQGGNILINLFFNPTVNAARGIAVQVSTGIMVLSRNFMEAVRPQITKNFSAGNINDMMKLVFSGTKFSYFLLLVPSIPVLITTPYLIQIWLGQIPDYSVSFVRLTVLYFLIEVIGSLFNTAVYATGHIRKYNLIIFGCILFNIPISYVWLNFSSHPEIVYVVSIILSFITIVLRMIIVPKIVEFSVKKFLIQVGLKITVVSALAIVPVVALMVVKVDNMFSFLLTVTVSVCWTIISIWIVGCSKNERKLVLNYVRNKISHSPQPSN